MSSVGASVMVKQEEGGALSGPNGMVAKPMSLYTGALIEGVDLRGKLLPEQIAFIRQMLLRWKVVFFRDQFLDHVQQVRFAACFGDLTTGHPVYGGGVEGHPQVYSVAKLRHSKRQVGEKLMRTWTGWHADVTPAHNPPFASILRADQIPPYGGDTQWTNCAVAYQRLSPVMQKIVEGLRGLHSYHPKPGLKGSAEYRATIEKKALCTEHPLVTVHPETGEKILYVSPTFLESIVGLSPRENQAMLELLWEHVSQQEFTARFRWEVGSVAFWDNRAALHLAPTDIFHMDCDRQMYRVTLVGEVPVGVDGRPSTCISGDPVLAAEAANI